MSALKWLGIALEKGAGMGQAITVAAGRQKEIAAAQAAQQRELAVQKRTGKRPKAAPRPSRAEGCTPCAAKKRAAAMYNALWKPR